MEVKKIKNAKGEVMTTKEGKELHELRFEPGDEFIPVFNTVLKKERTIDMNGKKKTITNYTLKCRVRDANKKPFVLDGEEEVFVTLTPAQAKSMEKKVEDGVDLNQNLFVAYKYKSENYGDQIGLGLKKSEKSKTFEDFEKGVEE